MSSPGAQTITVRHDGTERVFDSAQHITMGRAPEVTLYVNSPLVSRVHATLAWQGHGWVLTDNGSTNGVFVDARRLSQPVTIDRPTQVRLGDAITGPLLSLTPGPRPQVRAPQPPAQPQSYQPPQHRPQPPQHYPPAPQHRPPPAQPPNYPPSQMPQRPPTPQPYQQYQPPRPAYQPPQQPIPPHHQPVPPQAPVPPPTSAEPEQPNFSMTMKADFKSRPIVPPKPGKASTGPIAKADRIPPGGLGIGRTTDNQIVVNDPLASRKHARLVARKGELVIEDLNSANGTFVNGHRQQSTVLRELDVVTIGNVDFEVQDGTLVHRKKPAAEQGLGVHGVGFTVENNKQLLVDVNLQAGPGSLTALIGPSGAGKSTLARLVAGATNPTVGVVTFEGRSLHGEYEALRSRIGMVPQDDVLHLKLTVRQALGYAAELRLPPDTTKADRQKVIDGVLKELSLTEHADTRVDRLSGGQRKRASVAMELLTGPSLLILDEPTSGLDPALDRQVMVMLRELADAGRVVMVVTHSVACLDMCDQVLLLAPGGKTAFCGHPSGVGSAMGTSDWAKIFGDVAANPDQAFAAYRSRQASAPVPPPPPVQGNGQAGKPPKTNARKQFSTLARRQIRLMFADRVYSLSLLLMPLIVGLLTLAAPGSNGFKKPGLVMDPVTGNFVVPNSGEAQTLLSFLVIGAFFMGMSLSVRDLVGERTIFHRERAVGLSAFAYLWAKILVFSIAAAYQIAVMIGIVLLLKNAPDEGVVIPLGAVELFADLLLLAITSVVLGLLISSFVKSNEQMMAGLILALVVQLVTMGSFIPVTDRPGLEQASWLFPSRWGYSASAATVDLRELVISAKPDKFWQHETMWWAIDMGALVGLALILALFTWRRLRLKKSAS
ncbi:FHA domain-containing protein [Nocardia goodfellowii]|uniref:ABC-type multidrug transport system ATPase subunit/predicted component of type VI protein secretion system/ABC-type multidrug transport system permease subunit n=1 Tax=Nocardia goodfellowii TaxID=882446 RepID=A0ABS4Q9F1_9NOCA|nr:FHA domain-containing protein [Nocardia goodfellowii]MBP2187346.1 ABC-type multidrug transport system ATPase subunit/predicted component of type VI protein secretion system/ABC-type multidrug transport system permease subunit [Nocardia goodfellowii]